jgi:hypothetical protein
MMRVVEDQEAAFAGIEQLGGALVSPSLEAVLGW